MSNYWFYVPIIGPHIGAIVGSLLYDLFVGLHWPPPPSSTRLEGNRKKILIRNFWTWSSIRINYFETNRQNLSSHLVWYFFQCLPSSSLLWGKGWWRRRRGLTLKVVNDLPKTSDAAKWLSFGKIFWHLIVFWTYLVYYTICICLMKIYI